METLADLLDSVVEFLVGGMVFSAALVFLFVAASGPGVLDTHGMKWLNPGSTIVSVGFVALAYAVGVVAESLARSFFEPILDRATVREDAFRPAPPRGADGSRSGQSTDTKRFDSPSGPSAAGLPDHGSAEESTQSGAQSSGLEGAKNSVKEVRRKPGPWAALWMLTDGEYDRVTYDCAIKARDDQRFRIIGDEALHEALHNEVQGQLKRLRVERVCALSLMITTFAFGIRGDWASAVIAAVSSVVLVGLVNTRCRRYCRAIARGSFLISKVDNESGNSNASE